MAVQSIPATTLVVVEAAFPLRVFVELFDGPAGVREMYEAIARDVRAEVAQVVGRVAGLTRQRSLHQEPSRGPGADAARRGRGRWTGGAVHAARRDLLAQGPRCAVAPRDRRVVVIGQGRRDLLGGMHIGGTLLPWSSHATVGGRRCRRRRG